MSQDCDSGPPHFRKLPIRNLCCRNKLFRHINDDEKQTMLEKQDPRSARRSPID